MSTQMMLQIPKVKLQKRKITRRIATCIGKATIQPNSAPAVSSECIIPILGNAAPTSLASSLGLIKILD